MKCDYLATASRPCSRPATHQLLTLASGLADVVPYDPIVRLARYCVDHGERLARHLNDELTRRETNAHHAGLPHAPGACAYCTPDERRRLHVVEGAPR